MNTVVCLPEKRHDLGLGPIPEQPPEKRPKLDDPAMELQDNSNSEGAKSGEGSSTRTHRVTKFFCLICRVNGHNCYNCPNKSKGMGWGCRYCYGPCKKKDGDPRNHWSSETVKFCVECGNMGNHWADECRFRSDAEVEDDSGTTDDGPIDDGDWI